MIRIALSASGGDQTTDAPIGEVLDANIVLKFYESVGRMFADLVKQEFDQEMEHRKVWPG